MNQRPGVLGALMVLFASLSVIPSHAQAAASPWPTRGHDNFHTGRGTGTGATGIQSWSFQSGAIVESSPVIGFTGSLYVGSDDGNLYAIGLGGVLNWAFKTGGAVRSIPAVGADGTIFVGSGDGYLYAVNPNGSQKWAYPTGAAVYSSPAVAADGTVYVGSYDGYVYAINTVGALKWAFKTGGIVYSSPAIGADGTVYVGSDDGNLYAIGPNGTQKWAFATGSHVSSSPAIGSDGTVYVGSDDQMLHAINPNGSQKWSFLTGGAVVPAPAIGADGTVYVASYDFNLYAINPNGSQKWVVRTGNASFFAPAIAGDGTLYIGSADGNVYALNPDGTHRWTFSTGGPVLSAPAIGEDGTIYVGSDDGRLYAILSAPPAAPTGLSAVSGSGQVTLSWQPPRATATSGGADSYIIRRGSAPGAEVFLTATTASTFIDTTIRNGAPYYYTVLAQNSAGSSPPSNEVVAASVGDTIRGTVSLSSGTSAFPLSGIAVQLLDALNRPISNTETDTAGSYSFSSLTDGSYTIQATLPDSPTAQDHAVTLNSSNDGAAVVNLTGGALYNFSAGLMMISLPYDYTGTSVDAAAALGVTIQAAGTAPIAAYDPASMNYLLYPSLPGGNGVQTVTGRGYWAREESSQPFLRPGKVAASPFSESIKPGWNLIGDPFTTAVDTGSIQILSPVAVGAVAAGTPVSLNAATSAGILGSTIWTWNAAGGKYTAATSLQPYVGYWMYVYPAAVQNQAVTLTLSR